MVLPSFTEAQVDAQPRGTIRGVARDADGKPLENACIVLCDGATGYPLVPSGEMLDGDGVQTVVQAFAKRNRANVLQNLIHQTSDERGHFRFHGVPFGKYRVVAQKWLNPGKVIGRPMGRYGKEVLFLGAERVTLDARSSRQLTMKPRGTGVLVLNEKCGNSATWFMLSTGPTRADPILGPIGWGGDFFRNFIGWNIMPLGDTTVSGLPAGPVHFALFAPDNVPGFGAGSAVVEEDKTVFGSAPFVAAWSDGIHDPPESLQKLFETVRSLQSNNDFVPSAFLQQTIGTKGRLELNDSQSMNKLADNLKTVVTLPDGTRTTVADLLAVDGYLQLQSRVRARTRSLAKNTPQRDEPAMDKTGSEYTKSLTALHAELGRKYAGFERKRIDWKAVGAELLPLAANVKTTEEFGLLVLQLVARLEDSHSFVTAGTAELPSIEFPRWDAGFACLIDDRGKPVVYHVDSNSPADVNGIKVGMTVESVNGVPSEKLIRQTMQRAAKYQGWSSERYLRYQAARWFTQTMRRGDEVRFEVTNPDGSNLSIKTQSMLDRRYLPRLPVPIDGIADAGSVSWKKLNANIGYIYVRRIRPNLIQSLDRAVAELRDAKGLIIDVRGNSGGGFDARRAHRNFNTEDGQEPNRPRYTGPIAVLTDARCISAGEGWVSWFKANNHARFFGETTAGASSRKTTYELPNKLFRVTYSVKWYRGFLDRPIERQGIKPHVEVRQTASDLAAGRDTVVEAARKYLEHGREPE